jgi:hypothetical protein
MPSQVVNACDNLPKILRSPESWLKVDEGEVFLGLSLSWPCHVQSDKGALASIIDFVFVDSGQPSSLSPVIYLYASDNVSSQHPVDKSPS